MKVQFLTANPLRFGYFDVVFSHKRGGPNFNRVSNGQTHFLADHMPYLSHDLGMVTKANHTSEASFAEIELYDYEDPLINKARFVLEDDKRHQGLSAGLTDIGAVTRHDPPAGSKERPKLVVEQWELGEISLTPLPRDPNTRTNLSAQESSELFGGSAMVYIGGGSQDLILNAEAYKIFSAAAKEDFEMTQEELAALLAANNKEVIAGLSDAITAVLTPKEEPASTTNSQESTQETPVPTAQEIAEAVLAGLPATSSTEASSTSTEESEGTQTLETPVLDPRIAQMVGVAVEQASYDKEKVQELHMEAIENTMPFEEFKSKLKSIQIQPNPEAPLDNNEQKYDIGKALVSMAFNNPGMAKYEQDLSQDILSKTNMGILSPGVLAIPKDALETSLAEAMVQLNTQVGTGGNAANAVSRVQGPFIRSDVPDPLNILPLVTMLPSGPGDVRIVTVTVPEPGAVAEPADAGYAKTGDASAASIDLTPHLLVDRMLISRLTNVQVPQLLTAILAIALARIQEKQNQQLVAGSATGTQEIDGIYNYTNVGSSADLTNGISDITATIVEAGIKKSFAFPADSRRLIVSPAAESHYKTLARPAAVGRFYDGGAVDGVPVLETNNLTAATKPARGIVGPMSDIYVKQWDNAVFVSRRYQDGNDFLVLEMFWDMKIGHPAQFERFRQD